MAMVPVPAMQKEGIKDKFHRPTGFNPGYGIGITTSCKDPVKAIKFLDYLCSEEGQILTHWGIKGVNYTVVNGKRVQTAKEIKETSTDPFHGKKTGVGLYTYPFPEYGDGTKDSKGDYFTTKKPETISNVYSKAEKDAAKAYGVPNFMSTFTAEDKIPESTWGAAWQISIPATSNLIVTGKKYEDNMKTNLAKLVLCKASEFESNWKQYVKLFNDSNYEKEFTKLVKARIKQLGN
jgi:putative aldouronate transport system substrate-binding protein